MTAETTASLFPVCGGEGSAEHPVAVNTVAVNTVAVNTVAVNAVAVNAVAVNTVVPSVVMDARTRCGRLRRGTAVACLISCMLKSFPCPEIRYLYTFTSSVGENGAEAKPPRHQPSVVSSTIISANPPIRPRVAEVWWPLL